MKRDLNLEGFSVSGSIIDFFALRKIIPDYRPINRRPDNILKYPLIISLTVCTCILVCFNQDKNRLLRQRWSAAGEENSPLIKLRINQPDNMSLLQARKKSAETVWEYFSFNLKAFCPSGKSFLFPSLNIIETL